MFRAGSLKHLTRLAVAQSILVLCGHAAGSVPQAIGDSRHIICELRSIVVATAANTGRLARQREDDKRQIDTALAAVNRIAAIHSRRAMIEETRRPIIGRETHCDEPAELYLSTDAVLAYGVTIEIEGNIGGAVFTFVSGQTMVAIIAAINSLQDDLGVTAKQCAVNEQRIELRSIEAGQDQFVAADEIDGYDPIIFAEPVGGPALWELTDYGEDGVVGDINCDRIVNVTDLLRLLGAWGPCEGCVEDLDGDGVVGWMDLVLLLDNWDVRQARRRR